MINKIKRFSFFFKSVSCASRHCYSRSPTEVNEKGLVSPDCEDAVSSQLVVVFPWFGIGLKKLSVQSLEYSLCRSFLGK